MTREFLVPALLLFLTSFRDHLQGRCRGPCDLTVQGGQALTCRFSKTPKERNDFFLRLHQVTRIRNGRPLLLVGQQGSPEPPMRAFQRCLAATGNFLACNKETTNC